MFRTPHWRDRSFCAHQLHVQCTCTQCHIYMCTCSSTQLQTEHTIMYSMYLVYMYVQCTRTHVLELPKDVTEVYL